jgi:HEPN domain-containing protein
MTEDERLLPQILVFHAQQAAEKAIKALLIHHQVEFPRTHVMAILLNLCARAGYQIPENINDALVLTRYAVATRYPGQEEPVSRDEAREAALIATNVLAWVEQQMAAETQPPPSETQEP